MTLALALLELLGGLVSFQVVYFMNSVNVLSFRSPEDYRTVHGYLEKSTVMVLHWSVSQTGQKTIDLN